MLAIITMAFLMMRAAPGGPFDGERKLPPATEAAIAAEFGFDKPSYFDGLYQAVEPRFDPRLFGWVGHIDPASGRMKKLESLGYQEEGGR